MAGSRTIIFLNTNVTSKGNEKGRPFESLGKTIGTVKKTNNNVWYVQRNLGHINRRQVRSSLHHPFLHVIFIFSFVFSFSFSVAKKFPRHLRIVNASRRIQISSAQKNKI